MNDCIGCATTSSPAYISSGEEDLVGIARYLGLAVAGHVITMEDAAAALVEWTEADSGTLEVAATRSEDGSVSEQLLKIAATYPRAA